MNNPWQNNDGSDTQLKQLYDIGTSGGGRNPIQEDQYQRMLKQYGLPSGANPGSYVSDQAAAGAQAASSQALATARAAQQLQLEANQPAIQTFESQYNPTTGGGALVDKYNALLDSITQSEQPALNATTLATNNELGRRGITGDSGVAQNQIASALLPVTTQFGQLKASTGVAEQGDLTNIASQIAGLRAGNIPNALGFSSNLGQQQTALSQAQIAAANNLAVQRLSNQGQQTNTRLANQFQTVPQGHNLVNTLNNFAVNPSMLTAAGGGIASLR